jgi:hypothetical protein
MEKRCYEVLDFAVAQHFVWHVLNAPWEKPDVHRAYIALCATEQLTRSSVCVDWFDARSIIELSPSKCVIDIMRFPIQAPDCLGVPNPRA